jgi:hypothetical protein
MSNFNEELKMVTGGRSNVRTPQFPGQQKGYSIEQVRSLIKKQKRAKGFNFSLETGSSDFNLDLSGTARIFLGFALLFDEDVITNQPEQFDFIINNEIIIDQTQPSFFSPDFMDDEYYYFPRPLSGTDELTVKFSNSAGEQTVRMIVYYI